MATENQIDWRKRFDRGPRRDPSFLPAVAGGFDALAPPKAPESPADPPEAEQTVPLASENVPQDLKSLFEKPEVLTDPEEGNEEDSTEEESVENEFLDSEEEEDDG